jgi:hypothetical protein
MIPERKATGRSLLAVEAFEGETVSVTNFNSSLRFRRGKLRRRLHHILRVQWPGENVHKDGALLVTYGMGHV